MLTPCSTSPPATARRRRAAVAAPASPAATATGTPPSTPFAASTLDVPRGRVRRRDGARRAPASPPSCTCSRGSTSRPRAPCAIDGRGPRGPLRRPAREAAPHRVGFVFQSFNLVPTLTRRGERRPAAAARGPAGRRRVARPRARPRRPRRAPRPQPVASSPAASSSASPSPARSSPGPPSCSPTSRPATSTRAPAPRCSACCATPSTPTARRSSWSRTTRAPRRSPTASCSSPTARSRVELARPDRGARHRDHGGGDGMIRLALADLRAHRLRTLLSVIAVVARRRARHRRADAHRHDDPCRASLSALPPTTASTRPSRRSSTRRADRPTSRAPRSRRCRRARSARVAATPGVAAAAGEVLRDDVRITGKDGKVVRLRPVLRRRIRLHDAGGAPRSRRSASTAARGPPGRRPSRSTPRPPTARA